MENLDTELEDQEVALASIKARQIAKTIMDYGVSNLVLEKLIKVLALELEDRDMMLKVISILENKDTKINSSKILV